MKESVRTEKNADPVQAASPSVDQVRPLGDLVKAAEAIDQGAPVGAAGPVADAGPSPTDVKAEREITLLLKSLRNAVDPLAVGLGYMEEGQISALWGDETLGSIAGPLVEIARGYGWSGDMSKFGPWFALLIAAGAPVAGTVALVKANRAAMLVAAQQGQASGQQQSA